MTRLTLTSPSGASTASISTYGAQTLSWRCRGREQLFMSSLANFSAGKATRGGIPVIFPQFGTFGDGMRHGFARLREWAVDASAPRSPHSICLTLRDDDESMAVWPHRFKAALRVELADDSRLTIKLSVQNTGETDVMFTAGLHTYLLVDDLAQVRLQGLDGVHFLDATHDYERRIQQGPPLQFDGETDRIYLKAPTTLTLVDGTNSREIRQSGFVDTVVWNPGALVASAMPDLHEGGHQQFVCVEAACVPTPVRLPPGEIWHGSQSLIS